MSATTAPASKHLHSLQRRIVAVRRKRTLVALATGIATAVSLLIGVLAVEALLDWLTELPWLVRAMALLGALGGAAWFLWRDAARPFRKPLDDEKTASLIEHRLPIFRTRLIASIQLARAAGRKPSSLVRALLAETVMLAGRVNFQRVVLTEKMNRALLVAAGVLVAASALGWLGGPATPLLIERALLSTRPLPTKTQILEVASEKKTGVGDDVKIRVTAGGVIPPDGRVLMKAASGRTHEFRLEPEPETRGQFTAVIRSVRESFSYRVVVNDATSEPFHVEAIRRPAVAGVKCEQHYPAYLGLPPVELSPGNLKLLAGSRLKLSVRANMPIREASVNLAGLDKQAPLEVDGSDPAMLHGEIDIPAQDLSGFSIHLVNRDGMDSGETATYRISLLPDRDPTVRITAPSRRQDLATTQAIVRVAFEAADDFGIAGTVLHYSINQQPEKTIDFDMGGRFERSIARRFDWKLASLAPRPAVGDVIEFRISASDTNNVTGPGIGTSERYEIRIVTEEEKRLDIANRFRDAMGGVSEVAAGQEETNRSLGEAIFEKPQGDGEDAEMGRGGDTEMRQ